MMKMRDTGKAGGTGICTEQAPVRPQKTIGGVLDGAVRMPPLTPAEECLLALNRRIESMLPDTSSRIIAFVGMPDAVESASMATRFAHMASSRLNKNVLLLRADSESEGGIGVFNEGMRNAVTGSRERDEWKSRWQPFASALLVTRQINAADLALPLAQDSPRLGGMLREWRSNFDLVLIDAPPLDTCASTEILCSVADGVLLVIEAERVHCHAARDGIEQIIGQGGRILGAILSKKRQHIPRFFGGVF
jgi:Mrp family chromosome partitioning ATPase